MSYLSVKWCDSIKEGKGLVLYPLETKDCWLLEGFFFSPSFFSFSYSKSRWATKLIWPLKWKILIIYHIKARIFCQSSWFSWYYCTWSGFKQEWGALSLTLLTIQLWSWSHQYSLGTWTLSSLGIIRSSSLVVFNSLCASGSAGQGCSENSNA